MSRQNTLRIFLAVEMAVFLLASLSHAGIALHGYEHAKAAIAEGVICGGLLVGLVLGAAGVVGMRTAGLAVQGFALLGTCVGVVMIAIGVGPRSVPDMALHACLLVLLGSGLWVAWHAPSDARASRTPDS